jgi:hypothetical protein
MIRIESVIVSADPYDNSLSKKISDIKKLDQNQILSIVARELADNEKTEYIITYEDFMNKDDNVKNVSNKDAEPTLIHDNCAIAKPFYISRLCDYLDSYDMYNNTFCYIKEYNLHVFRGFTCTSKMILANPAIDVIYLSQARYDRLYNKNYNIIYTIPNDFDKFIKMHAEDLENGTTDSIRLI